MEWGADFLHEEIFPSNNEKIAKLTVTEMICMKCGASALFVEPKSEIPDS